MKKIVIIIWVLFGCLALVSGCAGTNKIEMQKKLAAMSDQELINHYKMIEMRMTDLDRTKQQSVEKDRNAYGGSYYQKEYKYNQLGHLHIGDNWARLKNEKSLIRNEMRNRGISPP